MDKMTRASILAFITAFTTLFMQVLIHRIVSAKLLNNYAFLIISLTMLGFAISGTVLTGWFDKWIKFRDDATIACAALFGVCLMGITMIFYGMDFGSQHSTSLSKLALFTLLYATPFVFCGLILGMLLSSPDLRTGRVYFCDLIGSSAGAFAVIPCVSAIGVEYSLVIVCTMFVLVTTAVMLPVKKTVVYPLSVISLTVLLIAAVFHDDAFRMRYPVDSMLDQVQKAGPEYGIDYTRWDPLSRIELSRIPPPTVSTSSYPSLIGGNEEFHKRFRRLITQNNFAFTYAVDYDGTRQSLRGIEETIYASAYQATSVKNPQVAIIGVGGGFDILTALNFDPGHVTAIEINKATVDILTNKYADYFKHWVRDPRVSLINEEGRYYLTTADRKFDIIQLSGVDSYSGTAGLAHVFSENYLYTEEALNLYLSRLTGEGILCLMRLEYQNPREMLRALTTAVSVLRKAGISRPADHLVMITQTNGLYTAMLVKKTPFTSAEIERLEKWTDNNTLFGITAAPQRNTGTNVYQQFLMLNNTQYENRFIESCIYDIRPTDDNRPFFFRFSYWKHLVLETQKKQVIAAPFMEYVIIILVSVIGLVSVVCVLLPLIFLFRRGLNTTHKSRFGLLFAAVGVGYMGIEIAFMQKFGLFLGHPNYSLSVVLAVLLFSSGLGSLCSGKIVSLMGGLKKVSYLCVGFIIADYLLLPLLYQSLMGLSFWIKVVIVAAMIFPVGFCMGMFVPAAIDRLKPAASGFIPWAWGINGVFSVIAPIIAIAVSMTWGINVLLISAIPFYIVAGYAYPKSAG